MTWLKFFPGNQKVADFSFTITKLPSFTITMEHQFLHDRSDGYTMKVFASACSNEFEWSRNPGRGREGLPSSCSQRAVRVGESRREYKSVSKQTRDGKPRPESESEQ